MSSLSPVPPMRPAALVIPQDVPVYRIKEGGFFGPDDHLYGEGSVITFLDEPNLSMEPLNEKASKAMVDFLTKLDIKGREAADKAGRPYNNYVDAFENSRELEKQESKRVGLVQNTQVPLMGAKKKGRPRVERIDLAQEAPQMGGGALSLANKA